MLSGASGASAGAPGAVAAATSATAGSSSYSTTTLSTASRAGLARFGDHRDDRLADEARHLVGERAARRRDGRAAVGAPEVGRRRHRLDAGGGQLGAGVDGEDARHRARRLGVDRDDARVRMRRALEGDDRLAGLGDVVDEAAAAGEQRRVLDAMDGAAAAEARGGVVDLGVAPLIRATPTSPCRARRSRCAGRGARSLRRRRARRRTACSARR